MSFNEPRLLPHPRNKTVTGDPRLKVVSCRIRFLPYSRTGPASMNLGSLFAQVLGWAPWTQTPDWFLWSQVPGLPRFQTGSWGPRHMASPSVRLHLMDPTFRPVSAALGYRPNSVVSVHHQDFRGHGPKCQPTLINPSTSPAQPLTQAPGLPTWGLQHQAHLQNLPDKSPAISGQGDWRRPFPAQAQSVKTGRGACFFKCVDNNASPQELWIINETWHHQRKLIKLQ